MKEIAMLKRYQVLLNDWLVDHLRVVAKNVYR